MILDYKLDGEPFIITNKVWKHYDTLKKELIAGKKHILLDSIGCGL